MHKLRVGVLMGGRSAEREVSFNSGRTVCDHLDSFHYAIIPLFQTERGDLFVLPWHFLHRGKIADFQDRLYQDETPISWDTLSTMIDFLFIAVHGQYAEDGRLQGVLEVLGIPYLGSKILGSALGMNKTMQKSFLKAAKVVVPHGITVMPHQLQHDYIELAVAQADLRFPLVVKPEQEGSSLGVSIVQEYQELVAAVQQAAQVNTALQAVIIEELIVGMEFTCIPLMDTVTGQWRALPPTEVVVEQGTQFFDYTQKYMPGRAHKFTPARCDAALINAIQDTCIKAAQALDFTTMARIDGIVTSDRRVIIIDANSLSGMAPASFIFREAAEVGMGHVQLINHLIETEMRLYGDTFKGHSALAQEVPVSTTTKMRVAVLMGGASDEREISLESGRNITYKLSPHRYTVIPLFVTKDMKLFRLSEQLLVRNSTAEIESLVAHTDYIEWNDLPAIADFVFIGLHGGLGENGAVQGFLEMLGLPYNGSGVLASALCIDKYKTTQFLKNEGFATPTSVLVQQDAWRSDSQSIRNRIQAIGSSSYIVKPSDNGCSVMVKKAYSLDEVVDYIEQLLISSTTALVEECIEGVELTVGVLGNASVTVLPPSQVIAAQGVLSIEEKFLPGAGENRTPAQLNAQAVALVQEVVGAAYTQLGCSGYARIDCFYQSKAKSPSGKDRVVILEVNTLPGMTPATCIFHQAAEIGMRPMEFIDRIIELGIERHVHPLAFEQTAQVVAGDNDQQQ